MPTNAKKDVPHILGDGPLTCIVTYITLAPLASEGRLLAQWEFPIEAITPLRRQYGCILERLCEPLVSIFTSKHRTLLL